MVATLSGWLPHARHDCHALGKSKKVATMRPICLATLLRFGWQSCSDFSGYFGPRNALLALLSSGDHLLAQECLYGGTHTLLSKNFASFGITYSFVNGDDKTSWKKALKPNTKAFYVEAMANPLLQVSDLKGVVEFCKENNLISIIDNTFASP